MLRIKLHALKSTMGSCAAQMKCRIASDSIAIRFGCCFAARHQSRNFDDGGTEIAIGYRHHSHSVFPSRRVVADAPPIAAVDLLRAGAQHRSQRMFNRTELGRLLGRTIALAGLAMGPAVLATTALAGSCPADKMKADVREPVKFAAVGVTDTTLGAIDLEKEPAKIKDRQLRFRKLTIEPNGIVPWHSHGDRPALIFVAEGEIIEYASNCAAPIVHKAGEIRPETSGTSHWWKNLGDKTVILYVGDVLHDKTDKNM
jgi:quercetin dioxygenase-like cupin family protein